MTDINIQILRYILAIAQTGSINQAAQNLYISRSSLSRMVKELELQIGITLFQRTNKGITPTTEGQLFLERAQHLILEADRLKQQYFQSTTSQNTLLVVSQHSTIAVSSFIQFYQKYCLHKEQLNLALLEETKERIIELVSSGIYGIGVLCYTSAQEASLFQEFQELGLQYHMLDKNSICVQVGNQHPLASYNSVNMDMLAPYPHVLFNNEDLAQLYYSANTSPYHPNASQKRITVCERGTLLELLTQTDAYYVGGNLQLFSFYHNKPIRYIPLENINYTLNTVWIQRENHTLSKLEKSFVSILEDFYATNKDSSKPEK